MFSAGRKEAVAHQKEVEEKEKQAKEKEEKEKKDREELESQPFPRPWQEVTSQLLDTKTVSIPARPLSVDFHAGVVACIPEDAKYVQTFDSHTTEMLVHLNRFNLWLH